MERYFYRIPAWHGEFRNSGANWHEFQDMVRKFTFLEETRSFDAIVLLDTRVGSEC